MWYSGSDRITGLDTKDTELINRGTFTMRKPYRNDKKRRIQKKAIKEKPMTVCIAAIAEANTKYPKIVLTADRLVSTWVNYTSGTGKIRPLTNYCWVLIATNNALVSEDIITKSIEKLAETSKETNEKLSVEQIVEIISVECKRRLDAERERFVLSPHGLTYDSYITRSKELSREHIDIITNNLKDFETRDYDFEVELLVVGIDAKPHIFTIFQNGQFVSYDVEGFAMVGSGKATAFPEITKYLYHPNVNWLYALHRVYNSKRVAERVGGVGPETDLIVLHMVDNGDVTYWPADDDTKKLLDSGMEEVKKQEVTIYTKLLEKFNNLFLSSEPKK